MSEEIVLASFKTLVDGLTNPASGQALLSASYTDLPNLEADVIPCPWALIQPGTLTDAPIDGVDNQMQGPYTILYFDELGDGASLFTVAQIMKNARLFAQQVRAALRADYTLGGTVIWAGKGEGTTMHYADAGLVRPFGQLPYWCVPLDVDVLDYPDQ